MTLNTINSKITFLGITDIISWCINWFIIVKINFILSNFVPESVYKTFLENMPIFCIDFLINCDKEFLLLKRNEEPLKGVFWMPGGRLHKNETIENFLIRVQSREIGRFFKNYNKN